MNQNWTSDPRLQRMDPKKLRLLSDFAKRLSKASGNQKYAVFLEFNQQLNQAGHPLSQEERMLLFSILTEEMTPEEKKKAQLIQELAKKLSSS